MTVVSFEPRSPQPPRFSASDSFTTPADTMPRRVRPLDMGCDLPGAYEERPGVSLGVRAWAFGSMFAAIVVGAIYLLAHV